MDKPNKSDKKYFACSMNEHYDERYYDDLEKYYTEKYQKALDSIREEEAYYPNEIETLQQLIHNYGELMREFLMVAGMLAEERMEAIEKENER